MHLPWRGRSPSDLSPSVAAAAAAVARNPATAAPAAAAAPWMTLSAASPRPSAASVACSARSCCWSGLIGCRPQQAPPALAPASLRAAGLAP